MIKRGWKVTSPDLKSVVVGTNHPPEIAAATITYSYEDWVRPNKNCGYMCVFESRELAEIFAEIHLWNVIGVIHECLYRPFYPTKNKGVQFHVHGINNYTGWMIDWCKQHTTLAKAVLLIHDLYPGIQK